MHGFLAYTTSQDKQGLQSNSGLSNHDLGSGDVSKRYLFPRKRAAVHAANF